VNTCKVSRRFGSVFALANQKNRQIKYPTQIKKEISTMISSVKTILLALLGATSFCQAQNCALVTAEIRLNTTVVDIADAAYNGVIQLVDPLTCGGSGTSVTCTYDYAIADSNFDQVCQAAGGQRVDGDFTVDCKVSGGKVTYYYKTVPACIARSCNLTAPADLYQTVLNEHANRMNTINGLSECQAKIADSGASAKTGLLFVGASMLATVMAFF
jgi:hypothetical protein